MSQPFRRSFGRLFTFPSKPVDMAALNNVMRGTMFNAYSHVISSLSHIMSPLDNFIVEEFCISNVSPELRLGSERFALQSDIWPIPIDDTLRSKGLGRPFGKVGW